MKLSVHLITWNGAKYVPYLFDSLRKQSFKDWHLLVIDNNSQDGMVEAMKKELGNFPVPYELVENKANLGFAGGHNMAFKKTNDEYLLMLNQDMYLMPDCLEKIVKFLDANPDCAAVSPRLMKWNFGMLDSTDTKQIDTDMLQKSFIDQIDTLGLQVFRSRRVVEQYAGLDWKVTADQLTSLSADKHAIKVFGVSGALPAFRRLAMQEILYPDGTIFDQSYGSYKEDVDLAFRLAAHGCETYVLLNAVAYHDRSAAGPKQVTDIAAAANKKTQSEWVKYHSYKNHIMTLYKNEYGQNLALDFLWVLWYELKKFGYFILFDRKVLAGLKEVWKLRSELKQKRLLIKKSRKLTWKEMRQWWS